VAAARLAPLVKNHFPYRRSPDFVCFSRRTLSSAAGLYPGVPRPLQLIVDRPYVPISGTERLRQIFLARLFEISVWRGIAST